MNIYTYTLYMYNIYVHLHIYHMYTYTHMKPLIWLVRFLLSGAEGLPLCVASRPGGATSPSSERHVRNQAGYYPEPSADPKGVCTYICVYIYIYILLYISIYTLVYTYVHMCICVIIMY